MAGTDLQKFCDELRAKISVADVVGAKVKLVRKGREYTGLCPFHNEKTPSFTVNEAKGFYHCFGCGAHGDIIKFEMEANGLPFLDAVEKLAYKAGLPMPQLSHEHKQEMEKKASLYDIMEMAARFFEKNLRLTGGRPALEYLYNRGFGDDIIAKFRLGYAPNSNGLKAFLASKEISEKDMSELGLITVPEDKNRRVHDFFRDRVMIPIMDKRGRPIAFGGRLMTDGQPKYLNSPETPVFNKRRVLYNLHYARDAGFQEKAIIVCEGYMDVIAMDKYGIHNAVAPLGTALTEDQIMEAWRVYAEPTLCFDGDSAGVRAAIRSVDRVLPILRAGYSLKYAFLPDKLDPDEFLKARGRDEFLKVLNQTMPLKDLLWKKNLDGVSAQTPEQKALIEKNVLEEVAKIGDENVRNYYLQEMKNNIYYELGRGAWQKQRQERWKQRSSSVGHQPEAARPFVRPKTDLDELAARFVVGALVLYPELIDEYEEKLLNFDLKNPQLKAIYDEAVALAHEQEDCSHETLWEKIQQGPNGKAAAELLEFKLLKQQNPTVMKMRESLDLRMVESQIKILNGEIKECLRQLEISESFSEETYKRYESLKKELNTILNSQNAD